MIWAITRIGVSLSADCKKNCVANRVDVEDSARKQREVEKKAIVIAPWEYVRRGPHDSPPVTLPLLPSPLERLGVAAQPGSGIPALIATSINPQPAVV
jgi:hypothetical protein